VTVDDASWRAHTRSYDLESAAAAADFLRRPATAYARRGVRIKRVITDTAAMQSDIPPKDLGLFVRAAEHVDSSVPLATAIRKMFLR